jgi:hypothetical protein
LSGKLAEFLTFRANRLTVHASLVMVAGASGEWDRLGARTGRVRYGADKNPESAGDWSKCKQRSQRTVDRGRNETGESVPSTPTRAVEPAVILELCRNFAFPRIDPASFQFLEPAIPL